MRGLAPFGVLLLAWAVQLSSAQPGGGPPAAPEVPSWLLPAEVDALTARVELRDAKGEVVGVAVLREAPYGVALAVEVSGLTPGRHGFHIHDVGRCDPPDFATAGGHFNPRRKRHGWMTSQGPHVGDLPNLEAGSDGIVRAELYVTHATLGAGSTSLRDSGGTALVIHAHADDERSDPEGNAGARIVCGIIAPR